MRALVIGALLALLFGARHAAAEEAEDPTIIVITDDPAFREAVADVLVTSSVKSIGSVPAPPLGDLAAQARRLATEHHAYGAIWLSPATSGATLVTYIVDDDRFLVRELPYPVPLTGTQAAEAARMARTMLRALRSRNEDAIEAAHKPVGSTPPIAPAPRAPEFVASLGIGAWFAAPQARATPMTSIALAWRPHGIGAAITATLAPAGDIDAATFHGEVRDTVVALELRKGLLVAPRIRVAPGVGLALHAVSVAGAFEDPAMTGAEAITSRRYDPAVRVGVMTGIALPHAIDLGIGVSADCLLRRQEYEAGTRRILSVARVQLMAGLFVGVRL